VIALLSLGAWAAARHEREADSVSTPPRLSDVPVQGSLEAGADGHFRPGPETTRLFGYFALALDGQPTPVLRERIAQHARQNLAQPAADEAIDVLDRYLRMQERVRELGPNEVTLEKIRERFARVREIRREELGEAVAEAMFADQDQVIHVEIERRAVLFDPSLAPEERNRRLRELEATLPPEERAAREAASAPLRLRDEVERMRAAGATDAEIFAHRERAVGKEAAGRLAEVDRRRARWKADWAAYRDERARILADSTSLAPDARDALLEPVRRKHFGTEEELVRARYLDQLELRPSE
jgi:lipase chaperone LimK